MSTKFFKGCQHHGCTSENPMEVAEVIPAGPAVRRMARERNIDLCRVNGSGAHGRITPEDVETAATNVLVQRDRPTQIQHHIANEIVSSASDIPLATNFDDADVTDLEQLRKGVPEGYLGVDVKLTIMPFVMKAVAMALSQHSTLNASLDTENGQIVYNQYVSLGVTIDTPQGLVVSVVQNVDRVSVSEIAQILSTLTKPIRAAQFAIEDLRNGTFTVSNMGTVGGTYSTPIINYPEVAVLLLGRVRFALDEKIEPRLMLPLSFSYDNSVIDASTAARFLNEVIGYLESPGRLLSG